VFADDDLLPISALQHWVFCRRQCALIHAERLWSENRQTAEGRLLHERVHKQTGGLEGGRFVARGLPLSSRRLGLSGVADVVEFQPVADATSGIEVRGRPGQWQPFPIEYKRGRPKKHSADAVQLCAQAVCLEEMLGTPVPCGALFYGKTRRRVMVVFDETLRGETERLTAEIRQMIDRGVIPPPEPGSKCRYCSLRADCMPNSPRTASVYVQKMIMNVRSEGSGAC